MAIYKTALGGRTLDKLKLKADEANDMAAAGFRFSLFDPNNDDFRLSRPYRLLHNLDRDVVTIEQQ